MIKDCVGFKAENGEWRGGTLHKHGADSEQIRNYTLGLIEFQNRLHDHIRLAEELKEQHKKKGEKKELYKNPMNDTRYMP